jgi:large subunit ribosomal protein L35
MLQNDGNRTRTHTKSAQIGRFGADARARTGSVVNSARLWHKPRSRRPAVRAAVAAIPAQFRAHASKTSVNQAHHGHARLCLAQVADQESQMPKLKTKSGAKKRFKITASGKVKFQQSGKRHGMIKRTTKQIREHRGTAVLFKTDGDNVKKYWRPNG